MYLYLPPCVGTAWIQKSSEKSPVGLKNHIYNLLLLGPYDKKCQMPQVAPRARLGLVELKSVVLVCDASNQ
jgi:hypothetical protein